MNALTSFYRPNVKQKMEDAFRGWLEQEIVENFPAIERRRDLSIAEFDSVYRQSSRPVVMEGAVSHWKAIKAWDFGFLKTRCGHISVTANTHSHLEPQAMTFRQFIETVEAPNRSGRDPLYLQEWHFHNDMPSLADDMGDILHQVHYDFKPKLYGERYGRVRPMWVGEKGAVTILHRDSAFWDVIHAQIHGRKRWVVIGSEERVDVREDGTPDFKKFLSSSNPLVFHSTMGPGDVLYLPARWFHRVVVLENSISLACQTLDEKNLAHHMHDRLQEWLPLMVNQDHMKQTFPDLSNILIRRYKAVAKMMGIDLNKFRNDE